MEENLFKWNYKNEIEFIKKKHAGQKRIGGYEYYTHPIAVAKMLSDKNLGRDMVVTALFHDLLEDTDTLESEILDLSNERVLNAVIKLTKKPGYKIDEYFSGIKENHIALNVKMADRIHNLTCLRMAGKDFMDAYINETKEYFLPIVGNTVFEDEMYIALQDLEEE